MVVVEVVVTAMVVEVTVAAMVVEVAVAAMVVEVVVVEMVDADQQIRLMSAITTTRYLCMFVHMGARVSLLVRAPNQVSR
jgi:hypothetical protein